MKWSAIAIVCTVAITVTTSLPLAVLCTAMALVSFYLAVAQPMSNREEAKVKWALYQKVGI